MVKGVGVGVNERLRYQYKAIRKIKLKNPLLIYPGPKYTLRFYAKCEVNQATGIKYESEIIKVSLISFIFTNCHEI